MFWTRLILPFAGAYFLSYHFRTANTIIGPLLSDDLSFNAADLGLLTSAYFLAFGAAQAPLGFLLDRFGARRIESALLVVAALGAAVFASGHGIGALALGRGLIGLGVSACLMGALKTFAQWFPKERQASLTGWIMTAGTLGALAASTPLDAALQFVNWREIFFALAVLTLLVAVWLFFSVPDKPEVAPPVSLSEQWADFKDVLTSRHFWRFVPLGFAQIGGFMAVQSLWAGAWLINVNGFSRPLAADHIAAMSVAMIVAYALIGILSTGLARRGFGPIRLLGSGLGLALLALLAIITQAGEQHYLAWIAYGAFSSTGTLTYAVTSTGFPVLLSGRVNTLLNLMVFLGAFSFQWGMGVLIDVLHAAGHELALAHRLTFVVLFVFQALAWLWFLLGGERKTPCRQAT